MGEHQPESFRSQESGDDDLLIGIVGPCSAGKTTLIQGLNAHGFKARHIAQEHSFVAEMWQLASHPDILIFLDVSFKVSQQRRPLDWQMIDFEEEQRRLTHARQHADLIIDTDHLSTGEVLERSLAFLIKIDQVFKKKSERNRLIHNWNHSHKFLLEV